MRSVYRQCRLKCHEEVSLHSDEGSSGRQQARNNRYRDGPACVLVVGLNLAHVGLDRIKAGFNTPKTHLKKVCEAINLATDLSDTRFHSRFHGLKPRLNFLASWRTAHLRRPGFD